MVCESSLHEDCWSLEYSLSSTQSADHENITIDNNEDSNITSSYSSTRAQHPRKRVSFCYAVKVIDYIKNRCDYTEQEILSRWYNQDEYQSIQSRKRETIDLIGNGHYFYLDDEHYCVDGLYTSAESARRRARYRSAQYVVFMEQENQRHDCVSYPENIKEAYKEYSRSSRKLAQARGERHAEDVMILLQHPQRLHRNCGSCYQGNRPAPWLNDTIDSNGSGVCLPRSPLFVWMDWTDLMTLIW